jgi:hypothetical protein
MITNLTDAFRNANPAIGRNNLEAATVEATLLNPASTADQRMAAAQQWLGLVALSPYDGYNQNDPGDFMRWRELSLAYTTSPRLAGRIGARDLQLRFAVRNLMLWTRYPGTDPEANVSGVASSLAPTSSRTTSTTRATPSACRSRAGCPCRSASATEETPHAHRETNGRCHAGGRPHRHGGRTGCGSVLDVDNPNNVNAASLSDPASARAQVNGASPRSRALPASSSPHQHGERRHVVERLAGGECSFRPRLPA